MEDTLIHTMEMTLPERELFRDAPQTEQQWARPHRFLIVEDDYGMQDIWEKIVLAVDPQAKIRWSTSGEGAEKQIRDRMNTKEDFDLVIADIFLTGDLSGVDLWKKYGHFGTPFVFASSVSTDRFERMVGRRRREQSPFLLQKPLNPADCIENLRLLLTYRRAVL